MNSKAKKVLLVGLICVEIKSYDLVLILSYPYCFCWISPSMYRVWIWFVCVLWVLFCVVALIFERYYCSSVQFRRQSFLFSPSSMTSIIFMQYHQQQILLFRSNLIYYPLAQQSTLQQPVYLAPTTAATGTTWSTNLLSPFNLPTNTNTTVTNTGTASPQTIYELSTGLFDTTSTSTNATGQPIYWPTYN